MQQCRWRGSIRLRSTTRKHVLSRSVSIQLNSITICPICLHWMFAIAFPVWNRNWAGGIILCGLPSPMLQSHFFYIWYKWNNRTRFGEKHVMFLGKHQQNNFRRIANVPNVNKWMFWMVKLSFGSFPLSVKQMFWYSKQEHYFVPFISLNYKQGCFWKPVCSYFTNTSY